MRRETRLERRDGGPICDLCRVADRPLARMRGLLGRRELPRGEGILLRPAASVHTWFMRFPIDVVFLDPELRVLEVVPDLSPWRIASRRRAHAVLELAAGECVRHGLEPGNQLSLAVPLEPISA
jgi:uncharacterized membrane protein (UPF0127 family)